MLYVRILFLIWLIQLIRVSKHAYIYMAVYNVLYLRISAPLYEARCSKNSDKDILYVRHRSKAYILVCIASEPASVPGPARV